MPETECSWHKATSRIFLRLWLRHLDIKIYRLSIPNDNYLIDELVPYTVLHSCNIIGIYTNCCLVSIFNISLELHIVKVPTYLLPLVLNICTCCTTEYWISRMLAWTVLLVLLHIRQSTQQGNPVSMNISYCEGDKFKMLTHDECPYGINFGAKKPDCVCINGV